MVECVREEACASCHAKGACPDCGKAISFRVKNTLGAKIGDNVVLSVEDRSVLSLASLLYLLPLFLGVLVFLVLPLEETLRTAIALGFAVLSFVFCAVIGEKKAKKVFRAEMVSLAGGNQDVINESEYRNDEQKKTMECGKHPSRGE